MPSPKKPAKKGANAKPARPAFKMSTAKKRPRKSTKTAPSAAKDPPTDHARAPMPDAKAVALYLDELERCGQYMAAAAATGRNYSFFFRLRHRDPVFAAAESESLALAPDVVRSVIAHRAIEGTTRMTKYGLHREYDNNLTLRYAEYLETGQWKQRTQVETGAPGAFKTRAELLACIAKRDEEFAKAKAEIAAEDARAAAPAVPANPAM